MAPNADYVLHCLQCDRDISTDEIHEVNPDRSPFGPYFFHSCGDAVAIVGDKGDLTMRQAVRAQIDSSEARNG